ncbi:translation initiation factor 2 [Paenibacillus albus]|uniref:Translation initiation factor 2 n=1 Tax=Paenibacillus albus TaxID=2495582 RepID=A0A3Q8X6K4_9BACL|nr:translation initiation factor 2 [Paenibacillus albus]AZN41521.1 translation initiation factor 2 [Paenibacillus albus]
MDENLNELIKTAREIQIAKIEFIAASITVIGDGLAVVAAGLALEALENPIDQLPQKQSDRSKQLDSIQHNLDYYINELIQIRNRI